jgi:hypothetical protein
MTGDVLPSVGAYAVEPPGADAAVIAPKIREAR